MAEITLAALFVGAKFVDLDEKDKSFLGQLLRKVYRESLTIMGALDVRMLLSVPRLLIWAANIGDSLSMIVRLEKYKEEKRKGKLKGVEKLKRELMFQFIKQLFPEKEVISSRPKI